MFFVILPSSLACLFVTEKRPVFLFLTSSLVLCVCENQTADPLFRVFSIIQLGERRPPKTAERGEKTYAIEIEKEMLGLLIGSDMMRVVLYLLSLSLCINMSTIYS